MYKVEAIVREDKYEDVQDALKVIHVNGMTISQVMGCGTNQGYSRTVRGRKNGYSGYAKNKIRNRRILSGLG